VSDRTPDPHPPVSSPVNTLDRSLQRILRERKAAREELAPEAVHDLRVALRRCRSLADGFADLDPHPAWRHLQKACKRLQAGLTDLRDAQVMAEWAPRLGLTAGTGGAAFAAVLADEERRGRRSARRALANFSPKRWKRWRRELPARAEQIPTGAPHFAKLALRRLSEARDLERRWRRSRSVRAAHRLRVGLKRFRYTLESFLAELRAAWGGDLKRLQRQLGEVHDLDVLRARVLKLAREEAFADETREAWLARIERARGERVQLYWRTIAPNSASRKRKRAARPRTLWDRWEKRLTQLATVNVPDAGEPLPSGAKATSRAGERTFRHRGMRRRPS
jgi:CHAD domain-containing protein